jgi:hypothetical protein
MPVAVRAWLFPGMGSSCVVQTVPDWDVLAGGRCCPAHAYKNIRSLSTCKLFDKIAAQCPAPPCPLPATTIDADAAVATTFATTAGGTAASACKNCISAPRNSTYTGVGGISSACPWACAVGFNLSTDQGSCTACLQLPMHARWVLEAAPTTMGPAQSPCKWDCNRGYWTDGGAGCVPCSEALTLAENATWVQVYTCFCPSHFFARFICLCISLARSLARCLTRPLDLPLHHTLSLVRPRYQPSRNNLK